MKKHEIVEEAPCFGNQMQVAFARAYVAKMSEINDGVAAVSTAMAKLSTSAKDAAPAIMQCLLLGA